MKQYKENIIETLEDKYADFGNLDISRFSNDGFTFEGSKKGLNFIDKLRMFFHKRTIDYDTSFWIINKWGGIGAFKGDETNEKRIDKFKKTLVKKRLTKGLFEVISSLSKIASFENHEEYFVYDSKAIFTLNWLILKSDLDTPKFFPMPDSRNKKLTLFDLKTIINLFYKDRLKDDEDFDSLLLNQNDAYFIYCNLIKDLNKRLFPNYKPYYLEMLLFSIADNSIFEELKSSVNITIK